MIMMWFYVSFQSGKHINLLNVTSRIQSFGDGDIYIAEKESFMQLSKNTFMATLVEWISKKGQFKKLLLANLAFGIFERWEFEI